MPDWLIIALVFTTLFGLLALRVPIGFTLIFAAMLGLHMWVGVAPLVSLLKVDTYGVIGDFLLSPLPLFILMANFAIRGEVVGDFYRAAQVWIGRIPGGLAAATCIASGLLGACSGSTAANAAALSKIAVPEMRKYGYDESLAVGVVAGAGTFASMIPPSIVMVIYGIATETPILPLFMAGFIPGTLTVIAYLAVIWLLVRLNPKKIGKAAPSLPLKERLHESRGVGGSLVLAVLVIGGMYGGFFTVTEASAIGAFGAFCLLILSRKGSLFKGVVDSLTDALVTNAMIMLIYLGAVYFGRFVAFSRVADNIATFLAGSGVPHLGVIGLFMLMYLFLGCFLEATSVMLITLPVVFPIAMSFGFDPIWLGVLFVKSIEIGLVTPPVGLTVYIVGAATGVPLQKIFLGVFPFVLADICVLILLIVFPEIALWLPSVLK